MKKIKSCFIFLILSSILTGVGYSQSLNLNDVQNATDSFSNNISRSVQFNSTLGLNWSDAYIGKFFPSIPPHFGIGITSGFTTFGSSEFKNMLNVINAAGSLPGWLSNLGMPLPAYTVDARIGGFFMPFDIGVKFGILPLEFNEYAIDYLLIGADIRYGLVDHELLPIKVSVGIGFNHLKGGFSLPISNNLDFAVPNTSHSLSLEKPTVGFLWGTNNIDLKAQVSLKLLIFTPYAGVGLNYAFSHAGYQFKTKLKVDGNEVNSIDSVIVDELKNIGISNISTGGFESINDISSFNMRLFGGISLNIPFVRFDLNLLYNLTGSQFGASLGVRFQI